MFVLRLTQYHGLGVLDVVSKSRKLRVLIGGYIHNTLYVTYVQQPQAQVDSTWLRVSNQYAPQPTGRVLNYTSCHLARVRLCERHGGG